MRGFSKTSAAVAAAVALQAGVAFAQPANPVCQRLEAQLGTLDRGNADPAKAEQIRRAEDAVNRTQFEIDQKVAQARRMDCESSGFFSIFSNPPPQCGPLMRQIDQQRGQLERMRVDLERLNGGTTERMGQRQALLVALSNNNCGPQYRQVAVQSQQGGFFDRLFGNNTGFPGQISQPAQPMGSSFRTICVRTCDGYYFPISFQTSSERFRDDEQVCQRTCPAAEVQLYAYHNPGEDVAQAVSMNGRLYSELPTAFRYRTALDPSCSCRRAGESWAKALEQLGGDNTIAPGDVVVTEQTSKRMSQPRQTPPARNDPKTQATPANAPAAAAGTVPADTDPSKRSVRSVGPTYIPTR